MVVVPVDIESCIGLAKTIIGQHDISDWRGVLFVAGFILKVPREEMQATKLSVGM